MRSLIWLGALILVVSCAGKSSERQTGDASSGGSSAVAGAGSGAAVGGAAATGSAGQSRGATGASGAGGTAGAGSGAGSIAGSGGHGERDAGQGGGSAGQRAGDGGAGSQAGTGGRAGAGESCDQLETEYATARDPAQMCDARATGQCQQVVGTSLACRRCTIHVNDASTLNAIQARYDRAGCPSNGCAGALCVNPGTGACTMIDRGDVCQ
jgi:hypothetical protein